MIYKDIVTLLNTYETTFSEIQEIISKLNDILNVQHKYSNIVVEDILYSSLASNLSETKSNYKHHLDLAVNEFDFVKYSKVIGKFEQRIETLEQIYPLNSVGNISFIYQEIIDNLNLCLENFYTYEKSKTQSNINNLIQSIEKLKTAHSNFKTVLDFSCSVSNLLENDVPIDENMTSFNIKIEGTFDVRSIVEIMTSINQMYDHICGMLNISTNEYPLLPAKIESGSLFEKVFGNIKALRFMEYCIKSITLFFYRNYTKEGLLNNIPSQLRIIEEEFKLLDKLKENGYSSPKAEDEFEKHILLIFKQVSTILSKTTKIEINDEELSIHNVHEKLLEHKNKTMLNEPRENPLTSSEKDSDIDKNLIENTDIDSSK